MMINVAHTLMDIRSVRLAAGMAQQALAERAGIRVAELRGWERGFGMPPEHALREIAQVLDVPFLVLERAQQDHAVNSTPGEGYTTVRPVATGRWERESVAPQGKLKVLDLFCGSGGFSHGFEQSGRFAVTAGIDLLGDRVATFRSNHRYATTVMGDIREHSVRSLADDALDPDIVIGGPPCQGFSSIRPFRTYTEGDTRNNLYEQFAQIVGTIAPRWFVLENVLGLLTNRGGKSFAELIKSFEAAGYTVDWRVVNAAQFGLPQNRERLLVVGNRVGRRFEWPVPTHGVDHRSMAGPRARRLTTEPLFSGAVASAVTVMEAIHDLPEVSAGERADAYRNDVMPTPYEVAMRRDCQILTMHEATNHSSRMLEIIRASGANRSALPVGMTTSGFSSCYSRLEPDRPSVTLTVNFVHPSSNKCIHPIQDRALTPREGARLQGFPDPFVFRGTRSQIVKQIGNAVPPLLGATLAMAIADQW